MTYPPYQGTASSRQWRRPDIFLVRPPRPCHPCDEDAALEANCLRCKSGLTRTWGVLMRKLLLLAVLAIGGVTSTGALADPPVKPGLYIGPGQLLFYPSECQRFPTGGAECEHVAVNETRTLSFQD